MDSHLRGLPCCRSGLTVSTPSAPRFDGDRNNVLTNVRLFDGAVAENVELVPDHEHGATWGIRGYQATDRQLVLRCEYRNCSSIEIPVDHLASRCYVKDRARLRAWCGK